MHQTGACSIDGIDLQLVDPDRKQVRMRNAGLDAMNDRVACSWIAKDHLLREIISKPSGRLLHGNFGNAFCRSQHPVLAQPLEPAALKKDSAVQFLRGKLQVSRHPLRRHGRRCLATIGIREVADSAAMVDLVVSTVASEYDFYLARFTGKTSQSNRGRRMVRND